MSDALLPVGRDCDCGFPMIWRGDAQVCAVYGRHPHGRAAFTDSAEGNVVHYRNHHAPAAELVKLCLAAQNNTRNAVRHRAMRAVS